MPLSTKNKISPAFSMASMTDIVFLLLLFFMISSTLISPNALKLLLPKSTNQTSEKPYTTVSITKEFDFYVETQKVEFFQLEQLLQIKLARVEEPTISLHVDKSVPVEQVVKVMNIAKDNKYKLILATSPE